MENKIAIAVLTALMFFFGDTIYSQTVFTIELPQGRTTHDLQSNSSSFMIEQSSTIPSQMHAVFMVSTDPPPSYNNRNIRYFYSTNSGSNWDYLGTVFNTRSGYPSLAVTSDGRAVVTGHCTDIGTLQTTHLAVDLVSGVGSWTILKPAIPGGALCPISGLFS